jgi:hypothetical protein
VTTQCHSSRESLDPSIGGEVGIQAKELASGIPLAIFESADPEATGAVDRPVVETAHFACGIRDEPFLARLDIDPVPAASQRAAVSGRAVRARQPTCSPSSIRCTADVLGDRTLMAPSRMSTQSSRPSR